MQFPRPQRLCSDNDLDSPGVGYQLASEQGRVFAAVGLVADFSRYELPDKTVPRLEWNLEKETLWD